MVSCSRSNTPPPRRATRRHPRAQRRTLSPTHDLRPPGVDRRRVRHTVHPGCDPSRRSARPVAHPPHFSEVPAEKAEAPIVTASRLRSCRILLGRHTCLQESRRQPPPRHLRRRGGGRATLPNIGHHREPAVRGDTHPGPARRNIHPRKHSRIGPPVQRLRRARVHLVAIVRDHQRELGMRLPCEECQAHRTDLPTGLNAGLTPLVTTTTLLDDDQANRHRSLGSARALRPCHPMT